MERFVHRGRDARILDVDEFQVAKALLAGEAELLSQEVDGRHLFDLCLQFGHQSTAAALISHGVPGCSFPSFLGMRPPLAKRTCPRNEQSPKPPTAIAEPPAQPYLRTCLCRGWVTCESCSWGFPEEEGLWMEDWDAKLRDAKEAAEGAAATPVVKAVLEAFRSQAAPPGIVTEEAMAYLLDVAILIGDAKLATCCAAHCTRLPLRRWRHHDFAKTAVDGMFAATRMQIREKGILTAALAADVGLCHLVACYDGLQTGMERVRRC